MTSPASEPTPPRSIRPVPFWVDRVLLVAIVVLALALRAYQLGYKSLWLDEVAYVRAAQMGGLFGPYGLASISHPPGYLFILRLVGSISHDEWVLRLPAMIVSVLGIVAAWGLGRALVGRKEGLLAALMLALSALHLEYAQEAHSYALFGTLSTFLLWSLYWVAARSVGQFAKLPSENQPSSRSAKLRPLAPWAVVVLLATASLYVHYYALAPVGLSVFVFPCFLLAIQPGPIASLWRDPAKRRAFLHLLIALLVVGLLFLPQIASQLLRSAQVAADRNQALEAGMLAPSFDFNLSIFGETLLDFITNRSPWSVDPLFAPTVAALWLVGLVWLLWRRRAVGVALAIWMLLPLPLIAWFASQSGFSFAPRRLIFILPVFLLVTATGVTTLGRLAARVARRVFPGPGQAELSRWAAWATIGLVMLAFLKGSADPITAYYARPKQDWKGLTAILTKMPQPGDAIVVPENTVWALEWYFSGPYTVVAKDEDLAPVVQALCATSPAVYIPVVGTQGRLPAGDEDWLTQNTIQVPLKDLRLYYRNCRPDAWYGEGAEPLFKMARQPGLTFPAAGRALREYQAQAAQYPTAPALLPTVELQATPAAAAELPPTPTSTVGAEPTPTAAPSPTPAPPTVTPEPAGVTLPDPAAGLADLLTALAGERGGALSQVWLGAYDARAGATEEAQRQFETAIEQAPDDWLVYALFANALANAGQGDQALAIVAQGLQAIPDDLALVALQTRLQGGAAEAPPGLKELLDQGRQALRDQDWTTAIDAGQKAVSLAADRAEAHLLLGDAYRAAGELSQALASYQRASHLTPQISLYHSRQSDVQLRLGDSARALDLATLALALEESRWENWLALGRALGDLSLGDPTYGAWAEYALQQAVSLAPDNNQAPARALAEFQAVQQARAAVEQGQDSPTPTQEPSPQQQREQAQALLQAGQADQALALYQVLVGADPQDRDSRMGVAASLAALGQTAEALAEYEQVSVDWPTFPFASVRRGELFEAQGDLENATAAYRAAVQAAPDNADLHFTLAFALRRAGQVDAAIAEFEAGLKLDPTRQSAQAALQELRAGQP